MDLICDAHDCDHVEDVETISAELIGKPCPKCGANLLTREDYDHWVTQVLPAYELAKMLGLTKDAKRGDPNASRIGYHNGTYTFTPPKQT